MRPFLVLGFILLFIGSVFALQAADAENSVAQGRFLNEEERAAVFKALPQTNGTQKYWLVSVYQNDALRTIIPIADKDGSLVEKGTLRSNLISAQVLVQRLTLLKSSVPWLVSLPTANKLTELSTAVQNEQFDVDIVAQSVSNASVKTQVSALKGKLSTISEDLQAVSLDVKSLSDAETTLFNVSIDTGATNALHLSYENVYAALADLATQSSEYDSLVAQAKSRIANLSDVDATQKSQWISLLSPLGPTQSLTSALSPYSDLAVENNQRVSTEVVSLPTKVAALESETDARMLRAQAYVALYETDDSFKRFTTFSTLQEAVAAILAEENRYRWKDQADVGKLETLWDSATKSFERAQYTSALDSADKAKALAKKIKDAGINPIEDPARSLSANVVSGLVLILGGFAVILIGKTLWKYVKPHPPASEDE